MRKGIFTRESSLFWVLVALVGASACRQAPKEEDQNAETHSLSLPLKEFSERKGGVEVLEGTLALDRDAWTEYSIEVPATGRYSVRVKGVSDSGWVWIEDYVGNTDQRTYNITGRIYLNGEGTHQIDGSPMQAGTHKIRVHAGGAKVQLQSVELDLLLEHVETPTVIEQSMEGASWVLKWSDEFDGSGLPDTSKWAYNLGDWGWGNNELQYYQANNEQTARLEDGTLIIRAFKDGDGSWKSARLTTQGRVAFKYGKIEFRAKVPEGRGTWAAGWLLGDAYRDEVSWPYCGEIDVLECVGFEMDSVARTGRNHASCHTPAYYFKKGNHLTADTLVTHPADSFHTYSIEWYPDRVDAFLDGNRYYTYDKTADTLEWPFYQPQNIILNLAIGGGWGGAMGLDPNMTEQEYILDYVRVYGKE